MVLILLGGTVSAQYFPGDWPDYAKQVMISLLLWITLSMQIPGGRDGAPFVVIAVCMLVAYLLKYYIFFSFPDTLLGVFAQNTMGNWLERPDGWLDTYGSINLALAGICAALILFRIFSEGLPTQSLSQSFPAFDEKWLKNFAWMLPLIIVLLNFIMVRYDIGNMGETGNDGGSAPLPFRLGGVVFYAKLVFIQYALLCYYYISSRIGNDQHRRWAIMLMVLYALSDMLVRSSKGSMVLLAVMIFFLLYFTGALSKKHLWVFSATMIVAIMLFPVMEVYRVARVLDPNASFMELIGRSMNLIASYGNLETSDKGMAMKALTSFFDRLQGTDNFVAIQANIPNPLYWQWLDVYNLERYIDEVIGTVGNAPSMLGTFYLLTGKASIFFWMMTWTLFCGIFWRWLKFRGFLFKPVMQSWFMLWVLNMTTEGTLDSQFLYVLAAIASIHVLEKLCVKRD